VPCVGENRTTGYQHNLDGKLKKLTSYNTATGNQVTEWIYGVTEASGSSINSNDLLWKKILPVGSAGGDGTSIYKYNRQDQATELQDAADTIHSYAYDKLGRNTSDIASNLATGVDASILKIVRDYDDHLRLSKVGSYATAGATTPLHEVSYAYNSFGQTTADRQEHDGAVDSGTREVGYQFAPGTANTIRPTGMTYPSSTTTAIKYTAGTAADKLSRPDILALGGADEVAYRYLGLGRIVGATYLATHSTAPVHMTYEDGGTGTAGDKYSGLDSFGRVVETQWKKGSTMMQNASYGYDRASNRKWRRDDLAHALGGVQQNRHDNFYWHDGLYQIKERQLGNLTGTAPNYTGIDNLQQNEDWCYDASGNWQKYGNTDDSLLQTRTHNTANEITSVANPTGVIQPAYDKAGNQTADIAPGDWDRQFDLKWDAWNRLIQVTHSSTVIQTNAYDGLSRRITSSDGTDTVHYYYDQSWRAVEEYLNTDSTPNSRFLWGLRSRWDLAKRERNDSGSLNEKRYVLYDAMDPVAICDEDGDITQRFEYSPFGETTFLNDDFSPDATPADWNWLFHGEFRDRETGYYNYGYRYYNPTTGRWPNRDPIGERGGLNLYGFVGNSPTSRFDRRGLQSIPPYPLPPSATLPRPVRPPDFPGGGGSRPIVPPAYPGNLNSSFRVELKRSNSQGKRCCCVYSSDLTMPRMQNDQVEMKGGLLPSHVPPIILSVDKPKCAECDTLPDTISVRIMIVSSKSGAYSLLQTTEGTVVGQDGGIFDLCDNNQDSLTAREMQLQEIYENLFEGREDPVTPDFRSSDKEDFGEPWK
jgi:RHS repeat-associated protein